MRKAGLPVLIVLLAGTSSMAQKNFLPGYIVRNGSDTIRGYIDYRNWETNPSRIAFMQTPNGPEENFSKKDLKTFSIDGKDKYERVFITRDMNIVNLNELGYGMKDTTRSDSIFLRVIVEGDQLILYEFIDFKTHFFIRPVGGEVEELIYKVSLAPNGSLLTQNSFRNQLKTYMKDPFSSKTFKEVDRLSYESSSLVKFVTAINGTQISFIPPDVKKNGLKTKFFAGGGMVTRKLKFTGDEEVVNSLKFNSTVSYIISAGIDLYNPRNLGNLIARAEVTVSGASAEGAGTSAPGALTERVNTYSFKATYVAPAVSLVFSFIRTDNFKIYLAPLLAINFGFYQMHKLVSTYTSNGNTYTNYDYPRLQKSWAGEYINAGIFIKDKFEICISYQAGGTFIEHVSVNEKSHPISLRAHYRF